MRHSEQPRSHRTGWLRAAALGANDGIISTASLVVGVPVLLLLLVLVKPPALLVWAVSLTSLVFWRRWGAWLPTSAGVSSRGSRLRKRSYFRP